MREYNYSVRKADQIRLTEIREMQISTESDFTEFQISNNARP